MQATAILFVHMAAHTLLWMTFFVFQDCSGIQALLEASLISACYLSSLFTSILVYRLSFHRLGTFPGPVLARSSKLWHAWKVRYSKNHLLLDRLHHQYGDFVRTGALKRDWPELSQAHNQAGPSELTIFDASAFLAVNGPGTKCTKSAWYDFMQPNYSITSCRSHQQHDKRRRIWSPAFGTGGKLTVGYTDVILRFTQP